MLKTFIAVTALSLAIATGASAATVTVDATANSSTGGIGMNTGFAVLAGQSYKVTAALTDTWDLGVGNNIPHPRVTNADGLIAYVGGWTQGGLNALYGTLVGTINGAGNFFALGTNTTFVAATSGTLFLYNFDSNSGDNGGEIEATISAVPVPAAGLLLIGALGGLAALRRRKAV